MTTLLGPNGQPVIDSSPRARCCWALLCVTCGEPVHPVPEYVLTMMQAQLVAQGGLLPDAWKCSCPGGPTSASIGIRSMGPALEPTAPADTADPAGEPECS